jgi:hypothetical protein
VATNKEDGRKKYDREFLVSKVAMMRIKGKSTHTILEFLMEKVGMSRKIAYEVLKDAQTYIMEQTSEDMKIAFVEAINRLETLYEDGDGKLRLEVQKELNKLRGLYAAQKIDVSVDYKAKFTGFDIDIESKEDNKDNNE